MEQQPMPPQASRIPVQASQSLTSSCQPPQKRRRHIPMLAAGVTLGMRQIGINSGMKLVAHRKSPLTPKVIGLSTFQLFQIISGLPARLLGRVEWASSQILRGG